MLPYLTGILSLLCSSTRAVVADKQIIAFSHSPGFLKLAGKDTSPSIYVEADDWPGVNRAARDLATDFGRVTGRNGTVIGLAVQSDEASPVIIVGSADRSSLNKGLVKAGKIELHGIRGQWESYIQVTVNKPIKGIDEALVIAGSDVRGTIFGIYDISENIGVSPWYWWADVPPKPRNEIYATREKKTQGPPSVKYRGFFINDEAPTLTTWAA